MHNGCIGIRESIVKMRTKFGLVRCLVLAGSFGVLPLLLSVWAVDHPSSLSSASVSGGIVFSRSENGSDEDIFRIDSDGDNLQSLTSTAASNSGASREPSWSPDGSRIVFSSARISDGDGHSHIYLMNADGSSQTRLNSQTGENEYEPDWSPDGNKIVYRSTGWGLRVYDIGNNKFVAHPGGDTATSPSWSPDGARIAFSQKVQFSSPPVRKIFVQNANASGPVTALSDGPNDSSPDWSPDGTKILFTRSVGTGQPDIWVMNADGSGQTDITNNAAIDIEPTWSPDGKRVAFVSNRGGDTRIWVMNADGSGAVQLTSDTLPHTDTNPDWFGSPVTSSSTPATQPTPPAAGDGRKVIFIQGIDSSSDNLQCNRTARGFLNSSGTNDIQWMVNYLQHDNQVISAIPSLAYEDSFLYMSYSGQYCPPVSGDFYHPRYEELATCLGIQWGADRLDYVIQAVLATDPTATFDLVGHSMGGLVASYWLVTHDDLKNRIHSVVTFDSPLRGLPTLNKVPGSPCDWSGPSWTDLECQDPSQSANRSKCKSTIVQYIANVGDLGVPYYTLDGTFKDNIPATDVSQLIIEAVPGDRTTLLSSNSRVHCKFDDDHSSVWDKAIIRGTGPTRCWRNFTWPKDGTDPDETPDLYRPSTGGGKESFLACAVRGLSAQDCLSSLGPPVIPDGVIDGLFPSGSLEIEVRQSSLGVGDVIEINPGMSNEETRQVIGLGSLVLDEPLSFDHKDGERIVRIGDSGSPSGTPTASPVESPSLSPVTSPTATATVILGDTNCDGDVDTADALNDLLDFVGLTGQATCLAIAGDVNCDGSRDSDDVLIILKYSASLPIAESENCPAIGT
jgi:pimeloyl-ACP methyl ester carboxylesterase